MRSYARNNHRRLGEIAHAVLTDPGAIPELTGT
jgi:hypothetical protein